MTIKEYNIKVHSSSRLIIGLIILNPLQFFIISEYLTIFDPTDNQITIFIIGFLLITSSAYLSHLMTYGKIRLVVTDKGIKHIWVKRFIFNKESDFFIPWTRIIDFETESYQLFNQTFINLTKGFRYKINRCNAFLIKDDFKAFLSDLPELLEEHKPHEEKAV